MVEHTHICIRKDTKDKLDFIAERSKLSKASLMELVFDELFEVCSNFKYLTIEPDHLIRQNRVFFYISGQPTMHLTTRYEVENTDECDTRTKKST